MLPIPDQLLTDLSEDDQNKTRAWWATLRPEAQLEFSQCWDTRSDDTALHGVSRDGHIEWHPIPIELRGRLVDPENRIDDRLARQQLLEFVNNHEEIQFFLLERSFHVCRRHPGAQACLRAGVILRNFSCGEGEAKCPMLAILKASGGRSVELVPVPQESSVAQL